MSLFEAIVKKIGIKKLEKKYGKCVCDGVFSSGITMTIIGRSSIPCGLNYDNVKILVIKDGVGFLPLGAFPNIKTLYIGPDVCDINFKNLLKCTKLQNIFVDPQNKSFSSEKGVLFDKDKKVLIRYPEAKSDYSYYVPETVDVLGSCAFMFAKNLNELYLPKKNLKIEKRAFDNCDNICKLDYYNISNEADSQNLNVNIKDIMDNEKEVVK